MRTEPLESHRLVPHRGRFRSQWRIYAFRWHAFLLFCGFASVASGPELDARPPEGSTISFAVVGDLMGHDEQIQSAYDPECKCYDYSSVFADTKSILASADVAIGNLEVTLPGKADLYKGYPLFGSPDAYAVAMKDAGFDILTLSNNHTVDTGLAGVERTRRIVQKLGMLALGTRSGDSGSRIEILERKGFRLALLNYSYGTNGLPIPPGQFIDHIHPERIRADLLATRSMNTDLNIVLFHFGQEYTREPNNYQLHMVRVAVESGADVVLGGHPHVLQPFELMTAGRGATSRPALVVYSLGNFVSHQIRRYTDGGMIFLFKVEMTAQGVRFKDIKYEPVLVYIDRSGKKGKYRVLPVLQYLHEKDGRVQRRPDAPGKLSKAGWSRMTQFYTDTISHLRESLENVSK